MRKIALATVAALLVAVPVSAEEETAAEVEPTAACEAPEEGAVLTPQGAEEDVLPPLVPSAAHHEIDEAYPSGSVRQFIYRLDVSGSEEVPTATMANVLINLDWDIDGDYDLYVSDANTGASLGESTAFNPASGAGEMVSLSRVQHCTDLLIEIVNYAAVATDMTLTTQVSRLQ